MEEKSMKTFPLHLEDNYLSAVNRSARQHGLTTKEFIKKAIDVCLSPDDYFEAHPEIMDIIESTDKNTLVKINSIKDLFK